MNTADFYLSLDIHESSAQAALRIKKGDTARRLLITLTESGKPYEITADCKAVFTARKPDGNLIYNACTLQGNRIAYALTAQTAAAAGEVHCELRLYGADSALITSPRFLLLVDDTVYSDGDLVESSSEFSALTELLDAVETLKTELEQALENGDFKGDTGETSLPVVRGLSADSIAYTATDASSGTILPTVSVADNEKQISAVGKGRQIVFIPYNANKSNAPTLQLNGGEIIPIRLRAPKNRGSYEQAPDATLPLPIGSLMVGVPYTLTFCGKYWLVDSMPYSGCVDITADYTAWTPGDGTAKTVANYAKTLADGSYRIADATIGRYEIDVFTVVNGQQWRIIRDYTDEFCYYSVFCGETLSIYVDSETGDVQVGARTMLTNDNIPLPTAADAGKALMATSANHAKWTAVVNAEEVAV
ncbi:MAG: BppU family phage baseplate upper protein [Faecousia sp.]